MHALQVETQVATATPAETTAAEASPVASTSSISEEQPPLPSEVVIDDSPVEGKRTGSSGISSGLRLEGVSSSNSSCSRSNSCDRLTYFLAYWT
jgi:hypothetical protein